MYVLLRKLCSVFLPKFGTVLKKKLLKCLRLSCRLLSVFHSHLTLYF